MQLRSVHATTQLRWHDPHLRKQNGVSTCSHCPGRVTRAAAAGWSGNSTWARLVTARGSEGATVAVESVDDVVHWNVEIVTHVPEDAPQQIGLELTVINTAGSRSPVMPLLEPTKPPERVPRSREDLQGRRDFFQIGLPKSFGQPAAVLVRDSPKKGDSAFQKNGRYSGFYLKLLSFKAAASDSSSGPVYMLANSYISTEQLNRLFVRDDALTNKDLQDETALKELMLAELKELRGEGFNEDSAVKDPRSDPDRIYRYATYNDLGGDIVGSPNSMRPSLGAGKYPYPRRLDTNRGLYPGTECERAPDPKQAVLLPGDQLPGVIRDIITKLLTLLEPRLVIGLGIGVVGLAWLIRALFGVAWVVGIGAATAIGVAIVIVLLQRALRNAVQDGVVAIPWTPKDDNFDTDKTRGFIGEAVAGALQGLLAPRELSGREFQTEGQVLTLYPDKKELVSTKGAMSVDIPTGGPDDYGAILSDLPSALINMRSGEQLPEPRSAAADADMLDKGDVLDLRNFPVPRCLAGRLDTWKDDEEMGRMFLAGHNPLVIEVLDSDKLKTIWDDPNSNIKDIDSSTQGMLLESQSLEQCAAAEKTGEPKLFLVDYWDLYGLLGELREANKDSNRVQHAGRCILFRNSKKQMVPVIIELAHSQLDPVRTYTAVDHPHVWQVAKAIFQSVDSGWHQLISHWLRTHASMEPFLIATRRRLPAAHPMFRLLMPHFRYTLPINAAARGTLINAGGVIETNFSPGPFSMCLSSVVYGLHWQFKEEGLVADLKRRGFLDDVGNLRVSDYPYAEDGLLIWNALTKYFTEYVNLYYPGDESVKNDEWLEAWWRDVTTEAHPDANKAGWVALDSRANLVLVATTIAWVASAHHAAVNFGQYDYSGWMPSHSSLCRKQAPARGSDDWQALEGASELISEEFFTYIAPPSVATSVMTTVRLLSAHAEDEHYLSTNAQDWLPLETDPKLKQIFESFVIAMKRQVEPEIDRRNNDKSRPSRQLPRGLAYTLLYPSSPESGVTMTGVPYSISI